MAHKKTAIKYRDITEKLYLESMFNIKTAKSSKSYLESLFNTQTAI